MESIEQAEAAFSGKNPDRTDQGEKQNVYLLDPENTEWTQTFARNFNTFVDPSIKFECVKSCSDCTEGYRIALLCIRHTDRLSADIESILENLNREFYKRTVLIYIHVRHNRKLLPRIATKVKVSDFYDVLGDILDFGLIDGRIEECVYDGEMKSKKAFTHFVMAGKKRSENEALLKNNDNTSCGRVCNLF